MFDDGWRFYRGTLRNAGQSSFDDTRWRKIDLPHDWSIEDLPGTNSPFHPDAISAVNGGFTTGGTAWYRKEFTVPAQHKSLRTQIEFEGVYMNADVWLNGVHLGNHPYGYTSFAFDITDKLHYGKKNIIAVEVKNEGVNSRWYSGSGIYRHVWLRTTDPVHLHPLGIFITTPQVSERTAKVSVKATVLNGHAATSKVRVRTRILNAKGLEKGRAETTTNIPAKGSEELEFAINISNPVLWSTERPELYTAVTEIFSEKKLTHKEETKFGIRTISVDAQNGFRLNGKTMKLKGACFHHDNGPLGSKAYDRAEERKVQLLKASGFNAIRCSHNPPSPAFLDACDREGMLVIDESFDMWQEQKNPQDYHLYFDQWWKQDVASMVLRDRNHPSVIMWSIGNEIQERGKPKGVKTAQMITDYLRQLDNTRPVTAAVNTLAEDKDPYFAVLDVAGYNYAVDKYVSDHQRLPQRIILSTESYPLEAFEYWMAVKDHHWVIGDFVWTAFDYIGEASIGWLGYMQRKDFYPWNLAFCGDIDICGWKRPQSYYRDALWSDNQLSVFVTPPLPSFPINPNKEKWSKWEWLDAVADWNWKEYENKPIEVSAYSSCSEVELFLNGKSLGRKPTNRSTKFMATWNVPYQKGELKAVGYHQSRQIKTATLRSAEEPSQIKLTADRKMIKADGQDLSYITVELADSKGVKNPKAENLIQFKIEGAGTIVGVGNANPLSVESYQSPQRKAWQGRCMVIVKANKQRGSIKLTASAEGLKPASLSITSY